MSRQPDARRAGLDVVMDACPKIEWPLWPASTLTSSLKLIVARTLLAPRGWPITALMSILGYAILELVAVEPRTEQDRAADESAHRVHVDGSAQPDTPSWPDSTTPALVRSTVIQGRGPRDTGSTASPLPAARAGRVGGLPAGRDGAVGTAAARAVPVANLACPRVPL